MRDTDPETNVVPEPTPLVGQTTDSISHFERHHHCLKRRVLHRDWIVEDHHHTVTGVAFERAAVFDDFLTNGRVVFAQQRYDVFRIGALSEPGEPAQIAKERGYLSSMAFQLLLAPRRNNQISHLRRQEAPQPAHALDLAYLVGDALFQLFV
jgi:hypothetical protein